MDFSGSLPASGGLRMTIDLTLSQFVINLFYSIKNLSEQSSPVRPFAAVDGFGDVSQICPVHVQYIEIGADVLPIAPHAIKNDFPAIR